MKVIGQHHNRLNLKSVRGLNLTKRLPQNLDIPLIGEQWLGNGEGGIRLQQTQDYVRLEIERAMGREIPVVAVSALPFLLEGVHFSLDAEWSRITLACV